MIITTQDNEIKSLSLIITNIIYNHSSNLQSIYSIHWQLAYMDKVKELIIC